MRRKIEAIYYPAFVCVGLIFLFCVERIAPAAIELKFLSSFCLTTMIGIIMLSERWLPYNQQWRLSQKDVLADFFFTMILFPVVVAVSQLLVNFIPSGVRLHVLDEAPAIVQFLVCMLTAEFVFYWYHRFSHEVAWLWKFHRRHHIVGRVYWMNAGTFHPLDLFVNFILYCLPFGFLNAPNEVFEYGLYFSALTGLLEHANVGLRAGALNYLFNTAEMHRWHHSVIESESKSNYGKALVVWDLVFGSLKKEPEHIHVKRVGVDE